MLFESERLYGTDDEELKQLAPPSTMATWRSEGRGPAYHKFGKRVLYRGADLNAFVAAHRVEPAA